MSITVNKLYQCQKQWEINHILFSWNILRAKDMDKSTYPECVWRDRYFKDLTELFAVSHCVYLVLQIKKQTKPLAVRAYNTQCGDEPVIFLDCRKGSGNSTIFSPLHVLMSF